MGSVQLYWWRKTLGGPMCIISGTSRHLSKTTNVSKAGWIASEHERIESPSQDSKPTVVRGK